MKLFPKIKFVEVLPLSEFEMKLTNKQILRGFFVIDPKKDGHSIFVLKRKGSIRTLLHELGHWLIQIIAKKRAEKWHKILDKINHKIIDNNSLGKWERYQIDTRKKRYANAVIL